MRRNIIASILAGFLTAAPLAASAAMVLEMGIMEQVDEAVSVSVSERSVMVTGAQGETLEVVSLTGKHLMTVAIDSPAQRIELNNIPKGCYILKVGKVVRKITVR